jgi:glucoamylase
MATPESSCPGWPGIPARWTSSAKSAIGSALGHASHVWFTLSHGIFNEVYYPRVDQACVRDMGLIITDDGGFLSEEKRDAESSVKWLAPGVPAFRVTNTCRQGRYRVEKTVLADPHRDVVFQHTRFTALKPAAGRYHLHVLLSPHLGNRGADNTGWVGDYKNTPMLFAEREATALALALACSAPWRKRSAGFVGTSDGWQDLHQHGRMTWEYARAENGNVALTAEVDLEGGDFVLALAFGRNAAEAGNRARAALQD